MHEEDSRVELGQLRLVKSIFEITGGGATPGESVAVAVSLKNNGEFEPDGSRASFLQRIQTLPLNNNNPFTMDVEFAAVFYLDPPPMPLAWPHYVRQVFPRLLFPYLREHVADLTRRGGFSPLNIGHKLFEDDESQPFQVNLEYNKWIH